MKVIDLSETHAEGQGRLISAGWRAAGEGDSRNMDVEVLFDLTDADEAAVVERTVPGAAGLYKSAAQARDAAQAATAAEGAAAGSSAMAGVSGTTTVKVGQPHVRLTLANAESGHVAVSDGNAEILSAKLRATGRKITFALKLRVFECDIDRSPDMLRLINKSITLALERKQLTLPLRGPPEPEVGSVVSAGEHAGILLSYGIEDDDGKMAEVDDCGEVRVVPCTAITSSNRVNAPTGSAMDATLALYKKRAKAKKVDASWCHLLVALGRSFANGDQKPGDYVLTTAVIDDALALAKDSSQTVAEA